jgi:hypothetical protein
MEDETENTQCECGSLILTKGYTAHVQTLKHADYILNKYVLLIKSNLVYPDETKTVEAICDTTTPIEAVTLDTENIVEIDDPYVESKPLFNHDLTCDFDILSKMQQHTILRRSTNQTRNNIPDYIFCALFV